MFAGSFSTLFADDLLHSLPVIFYGRLSEQVGTYIKCINASIHQIRSSLRVDTAINLDDDLRSNLLDSSDFGKNLGHEFLSLKPGVDTHNQYNIY